MRWPDIYLLCFAVGTVWTFATLLLGGLHFGHGSHFHGGHGAHGHGAHGHGSHSHSAHGPGSWLSAMVNPNSLAVFLAWFGGIGYLLTRHTGLAFWADLAIAVLFGSTGAWLLALFLRFLQAREKPLDPADYEMIGVLGRVSSTIRPEGVGELIYVRDGARRLVSARSEDGVLIERNTEAIVTRFERGVAFVRTWEAMLTQPDEHKPGTLSKETRNVK